jgi:hypothetical protein
MSTTSVTPPRNSEEWVPFFATVPSKVASDLGKAGNKIRWGTTRKRCPCGVYTLKRSQTRGRENVHAPSCAFYKEGKLKRKPAA